MGIGFVLLFWLGIGSFLAWGGSTILSATTRFLTRGSTVDGRKAVTFAGLLPFFFLGWAGIIFIFQAVVNEGFLHRDAGIGDSWQCPLPNGYAILMIDVKDHGTVYNPRTQSFPDSVGEQEDAIGGVLALQVSGQYILGRVDQHHFGKPKEVDSYFLLDTKVGKPQMFSQFEELRESARELGIQLNLKPIEDVYSRYRYSWFDILAGLLLVVPLLVGFGWLVHLILQLRRTKIFVPQPA